MGDKQAVSGSCLCGKVAIEAKAADLHVGGRVIAVCAVNGEVVHY